MNFNSQSQKKTISFIILFLISFFSKAYQTIEAEDYDDMFGIELENSNTTVGYIDAEDWLLYNNVDFGTTAMSIKMSVAKMGSGGYLEFRIDALDGPLIATFYPENTNSWTLFEEQSCNISQVQGYHNLYIIAKETQGVCNIDWLILSDIEVYEPNWVLFWSDEFNGNNIDEAVWSKFNDGNPHNGELQFYTPREENITVSDGTLKLIARHETYTGQGPWMTEPVTREYTSGKIESQGLLTLQYGKIEASMKLPRGQGTWPAFWMLGENLFDVGVGWPKCGEIDIMEHGQDFDNVGAAIHTETYNHTIGTQITGSYVIDNYDTEFHTYGVEWSDSKLRFYVDNNYYLTINKEDIGNSESEWPFDQPFWIILNQAVGGAWGGTPDNSLYPHTTEVDWVRVYKDVALSTPSNNIDSSEFLIYPNPGHDYFWVKTPKNHTSILVIIYDVNGKLVKTVNSTENDHIRIDTSELNKGFYIIKLKSHSGILQKKFIKI